MVLYNAGLPCANPLNWRSINKSEFLKRHGPLMTGANLLLIETHRKTVPTFSNDLEKEGHTVCVEHKIGNAINRIPHFNPEIIILDSASMRTTGQRTCRRVRKAAESCRIIHLVENHISPDAISAADITLVHPFTIRKVINAVKRLRPLPDRNWRRIGPLRFSAKQRRVQCWNGEKRLTPKETRLLQVLINRAGSTVSRKYLINHVWETDYLGDTRTLDVHISWLRRAIEKNPLHPRLLLTVRGEGYLLDLSST